MNTKEKILLVQLLLEDIRGDWGGGWIGRNAEDRALKAKSLCEEITNETNNQEFTILADFCETYIKTSKKWGDWDGRFFRSVFPMGYEKMDKLHNLKPTIRNKSKDFQAIAKEYMTHPDFTFNDWNEWLNSQS